MSLSAIPPVSAPRFLLGRRPRRISRIWLSRVSPHACLVPVAACWVATTAAPALAAPLELFPSENPSDLPLAQANAACSAGRHSEALQKFRQAVSQGIKDVPGPRVLLARRMLGDGQIAAGMAQLELAAAEGERSPELYLCLGHIAVLQGRFVEAQLHYTAVEKSIAEATAPSAVLQPGGGGLSPTRRTSLNLGVFMGQVAICESRRDWEQARRFLDGWLALQPQSAVARAGLGRCLWRLGQRAAAREHLAQAYGLDSRGDPPPLAEALLLAEMAEHQQAAAKFAQARAEFPAVVEVYYAHARWLVEHGPLPEALAAAQKAVALAPHHFPAQRLLGLIARLAGQPDVARHCFEALLTQAPTDLATADQLAQVKADADDPDSRRQALELAQRTYQQDPHRPGAAATLGWAYYRVGDVPKAAQLLDLALREESSHAALDGQPLPVTLYFAAHVMAESGRLEDTRQTLRRIVSSPGMFAYKPAAQGWLARLEGPGR